MSQLSLLAESLVGSEIVKLGNEIALRIRNGEQIYNYTIGDFDPEIFPIPALLEQKIIEAYQSRFTNYPAGDGVLELRQAVADYFQRWHGITYTTSEIQIASGGRPLIYSLFRTIVDEGDKVIYAVPSWNNNHYVHMNWGQHCPIETYPENAFMPRAADIAPHISAATLLCLCTPQNPTGTTLSENDLAEIVDLVLEENARRPADARKLYVMFDQMYGLLTYGDTRHINPVAINPAMKDYTIFVDGISKSFAATGVRVGWSAGPAKVIGKMKAFLSHIGAWAPMAEQKATAAFLTNHEAVVHYLTGFRQQLEQRLSLFYEGLMELRSMGLPVDAIVPQAAIYLTLSVDVKGMRFGNRVLETQSEVTNYLLDQAKLAIVPFSCFGGSADAPWYRLSVGVVKTEDIPQVLASLKTALMQLTPARAGARDKASL